VRDRLLLVWGASLMTVSLVLAVIGAVLLPRLLQGQILDGPVTGGGLTVYVVVGWLQQATLALGAALVAAHVLLCRLVPLPAAPAPPAVDWYAGE